MLPDEPASAGAEGEATQAEPEAAVAETTEAEKPAANENEPKRLTAEEELDKLRKAKARDDRRIGKLTAVKYQAQKEAEEYRKKLADYETKAAKSPDSGKPKESDFEGKPYGDYLEAVASWAADKRFSDKQKSDSEQSQKQKDADYIAERSEALDENGELASKTFSDFNSVMQDNRAELGEMAPHVRQAIFEADNGGFALYMLAKEGKLEELNTMSFPKVVQMVTRYDDKAIAASKSKSVSKAPAPMKANSGTSANKELGAGSSVDDVMKWLNKKK